MLITHKKAKMCSSCVVTVLMLGTIVATAANIPFIPNVTFVPVFHTNSTTLTNRSCDQCLCDSRSSHMILNCFPNNTCQFFVDAPRTYKLPPTPNAFLYFPRHIVPNASEDCVPDNDFLLSQLNASTPTYANVSSPMCLLIDDRGYLVTVSTTNKSIFRFHPNNLTRIDQPASPIFSDSPQTIAHQNGAYYIGFRAFILVVDATNMTQIHNISSTSLDDTRDMMFLNGGQHMIVASMGSKRLLFFSRSSATSHNYDFMGEQLVSHLLPHGLFRVNDTFFYLTSHLNNTVHTYTSAGNITEWTETLVLDASSLAPPSHGWHVTVDNGGRYWFSLGENGVVIFGSQGLPRGSLYSLSGSIVDTLIVENYVVYLSNNAWGRIIRLDPNLGC